MSNRLRVPREADLVVERREGTHRYYRAKPETVAELVREVLIDASPETVFEYLTVPSRHDAVVQHIHGWDHYLARLAIATPGGDAGPDAGPAGS